MKLTRQEAREILGVEDGAEHSALKKAFFKKSKEWHPDKVEEEKKEEATIQFQKINAAYQRLLNDESDEEPDTFSEDEEGGPDMSDMEILFEFFRYMEAKMHAQRERHRAAGGGRRRGGGRGPVVGGMFGPGPMAFEMGGPGGPRMVVFGPGPGAGFGPGGFGAFMGPEDGGGYGGGSGRGRGGRAYGGRGGRRRQQDYYYESDSEDDISSVESDDSEYEKQQERMFMRMKAEERAAEQDRVRQQYDDANRARREAEDRDKRWLAQLSRPARVSFSDTSITVDVDRGAKKRMNDFLSGQLPDCYFWELQYRPLIAGQPPGHWETLEVGQTMEVTVTGLEPGTRYAFRARPCKREQAEKLAEGAEGVDEEDVRSGEWSVESQHSTSGTAPQRASAATKPAEEAASGRRRDRKAKQAASEESEAAAARRKAQEAAAAAQRQAAEAARREAEEQRERDRQAAMARAAAEYERDAEAARRRAEKEKEKEKSAAAAAAAAAAAEKAAKAAAAAPVQRQASSSSVGNLSRSSSTAGAKAEGSQAVAAAGPTRRTPNGAGSSGSSSRAAATAATKPGSGGAKPAAAAAAAAPSSVPPEFRLPDNYVSPPQPSHQPSRPAAGACAPALRDAIGSAPAMRAPTRRSEVQQQQAVRRAPFAAGPPQPTALGRAAAAGDLAVVTSDIFAAEAAAAGMTPDQYLAYQEDLVMQEVLALSAAEDEVRRVAEVEVEQPSTVPAASQFPSLAQQQPQQVAAPPIALMPGSQAAPPLPTVPATAAAAPAAAAGPRPGSAGGRGGRGDHAPSTGRGSAGGRGRGRGRGSRAGAGPGVDVQEQAAAPAAVQPAPEPAAQPHQSKPRVVAVPRSAAAPPLPAAFAPASGRNSAGGEGAAEGLAPPAATSSRPMRVREGHAPYRPPSGPRPRAQAANGDSSSTAAAAPSATSAPAGEDDPYGWGSMLQEQPAPADQQPDPQGKAAGKKKGKASRGSKKGKAAGGAAGTAGAPGDSGATAAEVEQQLGSGGQGQQWEQPSYGGQQQYWEQPAAAQQQWDATSYQQQSYTQQPQVAGSSLLPQPPVYGGGAAPAAAAEAYQPYQAAAQAPISFGDFGGPASPRLAMQQAAPVSVQFQEHPQQQPAAAAPYQPHYVDPSGVRYVAVPADQPEQAQQAQQAAYQPYLASQPAPATYSQSTPQYYGSQWEAPVQQYGWSQDQEQQAQQAQYSTSGYSSATAGGYQQAGAPSHAPALAQKLSPESAAYGVVTADGSSPYSATSSSYSYAPQQAAATPGFAQPVTPAQAPAPYRPPSRPNAYRPHLGPPVAGAASSGASSAQQPGGAPNLSVLLPGSR